MSQIKKFTESELSDITNNEMWNTNIIQMQNSLMATPEDFNMPLAKEFGTELSTLISSHPTIDSTNTESSESTTSDELNSKIDNVIMIYLKKGLSIVVIAAIVNWMCLSQQISYRGCKSPASFSNFKTSIKTQAQ